MAKKIPISFNKEMLIEIQELSNLIGYKGAYGEIPKTIKFSITYTLESLKTLTNSIPDLDIDKIDILVSSIKKLKNIQRRIKITENMPGEIF